MKLINNSKNLYILKNSDGVAYAYTDNFDEVQNYLDKAIKSGYKYSTEHPQRGITVYSIIG